MNDIAPELLENIQERFEFLLESNYRLRKLYEEAEKGTATYKEANKFALEVGNALAKTYKSELSSDVLPDGKMYYNIAHKIFDDTLKNNYNIVADYCENVQKSLNEKAGISLKAQRPDLDEDRVRGFSELASNADQYDDVAAPVEEAAINFTQNVVNDSIKKNAEFQYNVGFKAKVVRDSSSDCCSWCDNLVGEYEYPKVPKEVYQRHAHCRCTVEYEPSKGKRQNVWSKEWKNDGNIVNDIQQRQFNSIADPMAEVMGRGIDSHPEEIRKIKNQLVKDGVEIVRSSNLAYGSSAMGKPGALSINDNASYSAWLHEYQHYLDDKNAGWNAAYVLWFDPDEHIRRETRAYQKEIDLANKMGYTEIAERLNKNLNEEIQRIRDAYETRFN